MPDIARTVDATVRNDFRKGSCGRLTFKHGPSKMMLSELKLLITSLGTPFPVSMVVRKLAELPILVAKVSIHLPPNIFGEDCLTRYRSNIAQERNRTCQLLA